MLWLVPLIDVYLRELKAYTHKKNCIHMFTVVLFMVAKIGNCSNIHQYVNV